MEKMELTVSIEKAKLDALTYALSENGGGTPQQELEKRMQALYEETVAPDLRGYVDYMIAAQSPRSHAKKPAAKSAPKPVKELPPPFETEEQHHE